MTRGGAPGAVEAADPAPRASAERVPRRGRVPPRLLRAALDAAYGAIVVGLAPYAVVRAVRDAKTRARWRAWLRDVAARFRRRAPRRRGRPCVWVHGVSVGEVKAAAQLVSRIEGAYPAVEVVVSVSTATGRRVAEERYPRHRIDFYPPDLSWVVADALDKVRPGLVVLVESGFWPNLLSAARERGVPVVVVNGRISERSRSRFRRLGVAARWMLCSVERFCVQLPAYGERFASLGVPPARIAVTGNMKLDNIPLAREDRRTELFARLLRTDDRPLLVAGSTHPTEERAIARVHRRLAAEGLRARLAVVPRHPERRDAAEAEIRAEGLAVVRRSACAGGTAPGPDDVLLLDTVGELEALYAVADLVFVGGTLVPHGGQNMMEPASLGRPVVVGPHLHNFRGDVELLRQADGLVVAADEAGVEATLRAWLREPAAARAVGDRARAAILASKGATERTFQVLRPLLDAVGATAVLSAAPAPPA
jgi:3-deoxy-D-manno-octulosonic-acid transferase